jgi:hypothetical protein
MSIDIRDSLGLDESTTGADAVVSLCSSLGVLLFGIAFGIVYLGARIPVQCRTMGGEVVGETCIALARAESTAQTVLGAGALFIAAAMLVQWRLDSAE